MDDQPMPDMDWRKAWASSDPRPPGETVAELMDLDFRLSALPPGELREKLGGWLDTVAWSLLSGSLPLLGSGETHGPTVPLVMLRTHIMLIEFTNRNLSLAYSLAWLSSIFLGGIVAGFLSRNSSSLQPIAIPSS